MVLPNTSHEETVFPVDLALARAGSWIRLLRKNLGRCRRVVILPSHFSVMMVNIFRLIGFYKALASGLSEGGGRIFLYSYECFRFQTLANIRNTKLGKVLLFTMNLHKSAKKKSFNLYSELDFSTR